MDNCAGQAEFYNGFPGNPLKVMSRHRPMCFVIYPCEFAIIFLRPDHAEKVDARPAPIRSARFCPEGGISQKNLANGICHAL